MMLIVRADPQLRRLERSIAALEAEPPAIRTRKQWLLLALQRERDELLNVRRTTRASRALGQSCGL